MAALTDPADDKFVALLEQGGGATRQLAAGFLRRSAQRMPLLDPNYPGTWADRTYFLEYLTIADHAQDQPANPFAPAWLVDLTVNLHVGYVQGDGAATGWNPSAAGSGETAAYAVRNARARALGDAQAIWRTLNANFRDTDTDPKLCDCRRVGPTVINDLGAGRLIATTTYLLWLQLDPANAYLPAR